MRIPLVLTLALAAPTALAMEGMWLPGQMDQLEAELDTLGLELEPAALQDLDGPVLGAIVDLQYCSGAFVSPDGLIATAYHCITDGLQYASTDDEDLFEDGFSAASRSDERWAGPAERIRVTTRMEDVTQQALAGTKRLEGPERLARIETNVKDLVRRCERNEGVHCEVANYDGREYHLIEQLDFQDVRIVFSPPNSVGYFGEDADNWQWPRHSGDFAFIRAYVAPDGTPAKFHPDNIPYRPEHHLPFADAGPRPGEFAMVAGYPSGTWRWRSAAELDHRATGAYADRIETLEGVLAILEAHADADPGVASQVAPRMLNLSNDILYLQGNLDAFERLGTTEEKWAFEQDLARWIAADPERTERYGDVLSTMHRLQAEAAATSERDQLVGRMLREVQLLDAATTLYQLAVETQKPDKERRPGFQNRDRPQIAASLDSVDATFDWRVDRDLARFFLTEMAALPPGLRPPEFDNWLASRDADGTPAQIIEAELQRLYANADMYDADKRRQLMDTSPWYLEHSDNPWFELAAALQPHLDRAYKQEQAREAEWREVRPRYVEAVEAFYPEARPRLVARAAVASDVSTAGVAAEEPPEEIFAPGLWYPDANRTLRVTIGKVDGYFPRDGLIAAPRSRIQGIAEKAGPPPFDVHPELLAAIEAEDFGPYADSELSSVSVNFLTDLDTARGSSGSATMNANGEFVGIIFDGNYEAMASDWVFEPALTRSIHTDASYILWYLDRIAGAHDLLRELGKEPHFAGGAAADVEAEPPASDEG